MNRMMRYMKKDDALLNDAGHDRFLRVAEDFILRY